MRALPVLPDPPVPGAARPGPLGPGAARQPQRPGRAEQGGGLSAPPAANCTFARGCGDAQPPALPADVAALVRDHPCYAEDAHHHFARMHVAVAPGCNLQCNYCNRKYDCSNESRPGVVSERLSAEAAVRKVLAVAAEVPELSVVGIAGPGDALANPAATYATLEGIRRAAPDLTLCLSTNGLALPAHADRLADLGIRHVTVTVNALDPAVGAELYAWALDGGRRLRGRDAAALLCERQLEGIRRLAARGVLVKVNAVVIPGINDAHLPAVVRAVRSAGAFLVNLVPLISAPEHGTAFGLAGRRGPSAEELERVQVACEVDARIMRHCRQCRADAVGRLGEDRFAEYTLARLPPAPPRDATELRAGRRAAVERARAIAARERDAALARAAAVPAAMTARAAVATRSGGLVDEHFGHAREFLVYDVSRTGARLVGRRAVEQYCVGGEGEDDVLAGVLRALADCHAVLVAKVGRCPEGQLAAAGIEPVRGQAHRPIEAALLDWLADRIARAARGEAAPLAPRTAADPAPAEAARVA